MHDNVIGGMQLSDFQLGFGTHNYGCCLEFLNESTSSLGVLVTREEVVNGKQMVYKYGMVATITKMSIQTSQTEVKRHKV